MPKNTLFLEIVKSPSLGITLRPHATRYWQTIYSSKMAGILLP